LRFHAGIPAPRTRCRRRAGRPAARPAPGLRAAPATASPPGSPDPHRLSGGPMSSTDRPDPLLPLEGTDNTRDIGGVAAPGGTVATGRVFRSDNLAKATAADTAKLAELGLVVSIDFRDPYERRSDGEDTLPIGVEARKLPILDFDTPEVKGLVASITAGDTAALKNTLADGGTARLMTRVYEQMVTQPTAHAGFGTALTRIANLDADMAGLYHCHSGKDRTGWMTAIVYSALGVDRDVIFDDYLA